MMLRNWLADLGLIPATVKPLPIELRKTPYCPSLASAPSAPAKSGRKGSRAGRSAAAA